MRGTQSDIDRIIRTFVRTFDKSVVFLPPRPLLRRPSPPIDHDVLDANSALTAHPFDERAEANLASRGLA